VHTANAYPRLVAILKKLNAGECLESVQEPSRSPGWPILTPTARVEIKALLTELGELPSE
jgi:hypothetical protein